MILVDTAIWADHIVRPLPDLENLLRAGEIVIHPFVIGELALGNLRDRTVLSILAKLPHAVVAFEREMLPFIERHRLASSGIGYVDAHLLMSVRLTEAVKLWTRDRRLHAQAERLGVAYHPADR